MMEKDLKSYFEYLLTRSKQSEWFRRYICYPYISRFFKGKVIDVGCGIGDFLRYYQPSVGADINPFCVDYCRKIGCEAYLIRNGVLPFETESFEGGILDNVIEHLDEPEALLDEVSRVIKSRGILVAGVPGIKGFAGDDDHCRFYDEAGLKHLMENNGHTCLRNLYTPFFFRSKVLSRHVSQYALYGIYQKK